MNDNSQRETRPLIVVEQSDYGKFEDECASLINDGYILSSSSCGFIDSAQYDYCSAYHAIFIKQEFIRNN